MNHAFARIHTAAALACLLGLSCGFFDDLVTPPEYSTATYRVVVLDTVGAVVRPLAGVAATLGGVSAVSDSQGSVTLVGVRTGSGVLTLRRTFYHDQTGSVEVELGANLDTIVLRRESVLPVIAAFRAEPAHTTAVDDTVRFIVSVRDSVWPLHRARIDFGDTSVGTRSFVGGPVVDTDYHVYRLAGTYSARCVLWNESGDSTEAPIQSVVVSSNRRPSLSVTFTQPVVYCCRYTGVRVDVYDPDNNFTVVTVDWGDSSTPERQAALSYVFVHWYSVDSTIGAKTFVFRAVASDAAGAVGAFDTTIVALSVPPLLVGGFTYEPPLPTTSDTAIAIGIQVVQTPGYIDGIAWTINGVLRARDLFDSTSGAVTVGGPVPTVFWHTFRVAGGGFGDTNTVVANVHDSYQQYKAPRGTFFISH
jgi:hypothetical protein